MKALQPLLIMIALSVLVILFQNQIHWALGYLIQFHSETASLLGHIFSGEHIAKIIQQSLALLLVPLIVAAIPCGIYWAIKKQAMPHAKVITWTIWIVTAALVTLK